MLRLSFSYTLNIYMHTGEFIKNYVNGNAFGATLKRGVI